MNKVLTEISEKLSLIVPLLENISARVSEIEKVKIPLQFSNSHHVISPILSQSHVIDDCSDSRSSLTSQDTRDQLDLDIPPQHHVPSGLVLSDSDLVQGLVQELSDKFCSNIPVVNYNTDAESVKEILFESNHDFVLLQDSGQAISQHQSLDQESVQEIQSLVRNQVELAKMVVRLKPDTDVFIGSLPPRYDTEAHSELTEAYNNMMVVESFMEERITIIKQNDMYTKEKRKIEERVVKDGYNLTRYGTHLMAKNIERQINKIPHVQVMHRKNKRNRPFVRTP